MSEPNPSPPCHRWIREWFASTLFVALAVTALDAALLQRKHDLFTGGFLSVDHLRGSGEIVVFLVASLVSDCGLAGILVAGGLWLASRLTLGRSARRLLAFNVAFVPLLVADIASYRIFEYFGGTFDPGLMFDLVGRRPGELLAVASASLVQLGLVVAAIVGVVVVGVWAVKRVRPAGTADLLEPPRWSEAIGVPTLVFVLAFGTSIGLRLERDSFDNGLRRKPSGQVFSSIAGPLTDIDGDGYGLLNAPLDPAPFDPAIHPYAVDLPGNDIDEDGLGGDLPAGLPPYTEPTGAPSKWRRRPDVVLVLLETFRADVVGTILHGRSVTPVLDGLARSGLSASQAWSHNGYTVQSRFHVFSGSLANLRGGTTLIDDFKANGYEVAYFSAQDESFGEEGLSIGVERAHLFYDARQDRTKRYTTFTTTGSLAVPFTVVRGRIEAFLARRDARRPLFLYVNFHDTHFPYTHQFVRPLVDATVVARAHISADRRDALRRMYLNTAANVDAAIGDVLACVRKTTKREPAVLVTADHGESLFEEGFLGHGYGLNDAQTRIPLVVSGLPMTVREPWGQVDLRDAIGDALRQPPGDGDRPRRIDTERPVFQYIGHLRAPAQISWLTSKERAIYDFRNDRFQMGNGPWLRQHDLDENSHHVLLNIARFWERMILAQQE